MEAVKTHEEEVEEFRQEVQNYLATGQSDVLTSDEKAIADRARKPEIKQPWYKTLFSW